MSASNNSRSFLTSALVKPGKPNKLVNLLHKAAAENPAPQAGAKSETETPSGEEPGSAPAEARGK